MVQPHLQVSLNEKCRGGGGLGYSLSLLTVLSFPALPCLLVAGGLCIPPALLHPGLQFLSTLLTSCGIRSGSIPVVSAPMLRPGLLS